MPNGAWVVEYEVTTTRATLVEAFVNEDSAIKHALSVARAQNPSSRVEFARVVRVPFCPSCHGVGEERRHRDPTCTGTFDRAD